MFTFLILMDCRDLIGSVGVVFYNLDSSFFLYSSFLLLLEMIRIQYLLLNFHTSGRLNNYVEYFYNIP